MNIQLSNTEEFIDRKFTGALGQVLIRYVYVCLTTTTVSSPSRCVFAADRWRGGCGLVLSGAAGLMLCSSNWNIFFGPLGPESSPPESWLIQYLSLADTRLSAPPTQKNFWLQMGCFGSV